MSEGKIYHYHVSGTYSHRLSTRITKSLIIYDSEMKPVASIHTKKKIENELSEWGAEFHEGIHPSLIDVGGDRKPVLNGWFVAKPDKELASVKLTDPQFELMALLYAKHICDTIDIPYARGNVNTRVADVLVKKGLARLDYPARLSGAGILLVKNRMDMTHIFKDVASSLSSSYRRKSAAEKVDLVRDIVSKYSYNFTVMQSGAQIKIHLRGNDESVYYGVNTESGKIELHALSIYPSEIKWHTGAMEAMAKIVEETRGLLISADEANRLAKEELRKNHEEFRGIE